MNHVLPGDLIEFRYYSDQKRVLSDEIVHHDQKRIPIGSSVILLLGVVCVKQYDHDYYWLTNQGLFCTSTYDVDRTGGHVTPVKVSP